jgi:hypothetical protein
MSRFYTVSFSDVTFVAAQDLVTIPGHATKTIRLHRIWCGHNSATLASEQGLYFRVRHLAATVTLGTGGSYAAGSITPSKLDPADAACGVSTARTNDSTDGGGTRSSTSTTATTLFAMGAHLFQGIDIDLGGKIVVSSGAALVFSQENALSGTVKMSGGVLIEEV